MGSRLMRCGDRERANITREDEAHLVAYKRFGRVLFGFSDTGIQVPLWHSE